MTYTELATWGNSIGIRLKKDICQKLNLSAGTKVMITISNGKLVLEPIDFNQLGNSIDIKSLCKTITPENKPNLEEEYPIGKEIW